MNKMISIHEFKEDAVKSLRDIKNKKPLVHNITNYVVMNYTAMALLSAGASPIMAHAHEEVEELTSMAGSLVLNIGTLTGYWVDSMIKAGKKANSLHIPVVLDPVGSGATTMRTEAAKRIVREVEVSVIRGNASEVLSLAEENSKTKGVDSLHSVEEAAEAGKILARELNTVLAITGETDFITDGIVSCKVKNGHPLMGMVTGTGCTATVIVAAFNAVNSDPLLSAAAGLSYFGFAGEQAAKEAKGPGSFQVKMLDFLYLVEENSFREGIQVSFEK
ncbi:MAG: hydroxyethylthiazole kinase [Candidatus Aminicenantaceae bacterium]